MKNKIHSNYKTDQKILKNIIHKNTKTKDSKNVNIVIYYRYKKSSNLVTSTNKDKLQMSIVIYKFNCPLPHTNVVSYIGMTQNCLSR